MSEPLNPFADTSDDINLSDQESINQKSENRPPSKPSIISEGFQFIGELTAPHGSLTIDGKFKGTLRIRDLHLSSTGKIEGQITAESCTIKGELAGELKTHDLVICSTSSTDATITYQNITIQKGAQIKGTLKKLDH